MTKPPDEDLPPEDCDKLDRALEAVWRGETVEIDRLAGEGDERAPSLGRLLQGAVGEHAQPSPLAPEEIKIEGYEILGRIGSGGMGTVYKAHQLSTNRVVAIKVMHIGPGASDSARKRFIHEVELTARLQHAGIVRVLEAGQTFTGRPYYSMDYVMGVTLDEWRSESQPDVQTVLKLFATLCQAVEYAHRKNVIHRDLKPRNVLVDTDGEPHILDFGLAKATDRPPSDESLLGHVPGTLIYFAPEQAAEKPEEVDTRTDVYALGLMLYETLTGALPYDTQGSVSKIRRQILETPAKPPSSLVSGLDRGIDAVVLKALAKEKGRRYASAKEFGQEIERWLRGEPPRVSLPSLFYALRKWLLRHRALVMLGVAGVGLAVIALCGGRWLTRHSLEEARKRRLEEVRVQVLRDMCDLEEGVQSIREILGRAQERQGHYPQLPEVHLVVAQAWFIRGQKESEENACETAIDVLQRCIETESSPWVYRYLLADMLHVKGKSRRADELHAEADAQMPDTAEAWYLRSSATLSLDEAAQCAGRAVQLDAGHVLAMCRLAELHRLRGDLDRAFELAEKLVRLGPDPEYWALFQAHVLLRKKQYREAVESYTQAGKLRPGRTEPYRYRAVAHLCLGANDEAIRDYGEAIWSYPSKMNLWPHYFRATVLWITGRRDEAVRDYEDFRSLRGQVSFADARLFLVLRDKANMLEDEGRATEAALVRKDAEERLLNARLDTARDTWLAEVFNCLAGVTQPEDLVAEAAGRGVAQVCEGYYYAGEACLLKHESQQAQAYFQKCVDTNLVFDPERWPPDPMNEYHLARWRLRTLDSRVSEASDADSG